MHVFADKLGQTPCTPRWHVSLHSAEEEMMY